MAQRATIMTEHLHDQDPLGTAPVVGNRMSRISSIHRQLWVPACPIGESDWGREVKPPDWTAAGSRRPEGIGKSAMDPPFHKVTIVGAIIKSMNALRQNCMFQDPKWQPYDQTLKPRQTSKQGCECSGVAVP